MKNFMLPFKYKALQILDESFLVNFDRFSRLPNFNNPMISIMKTKNGVCQCVSPKYIDKNKFFSSAKDFRR
jgi:hypothetical protein